MGLGVLFVCLFVFIATPGGVHSTARLSEGPCASPASSTEGGRKREGCGRKQFMEREAFTEWVSLYQVRG